MTDQAGDSTRTLLLGGVVLALLGAGWFALSHLIMGTATGAAVGESLGVVLRAADGSSLARSALCNLCHTMQPADQVSLFTARRSGSAGH